MRGAGFALTESAEALETPEPLRYQSQPFDRGTLSPVLQRLEWELDDEWSDLGGDATGARMATPSTTLLLIYPHLVSGTLPLNRHTRPFFPRGYGERTMVTLIDGRCGQRFPAWAVHEGRYIAGLRPWFEQHKLPAGAYIVFQRREGTDEIVVDFRRNECAAVDARARPGCVSTSAPQAGGRANTTSR
jgi:hypothetical protein